MKTILTVDDSRTMRDMLRAALAGAGFDVVQAEDGVHGLEVLAGCDPDVIVTDVNMPRMDGLTFIEKLRQNADKRAIPCWFSPPRTMPRRRPAPRLPAPPDGS